MLFEIIKEWKFILKYLSRKSRAVVRMCPVEKVFLEIPQNSLENTFIRVYFLIKLQAYNFIKKETLAQVFSCELCENPKNTFFTGQFWWLNSCQIAFLSHSGYLAMFFDFST